MMALGQLPEMHAWWDMERSAEIVDLTTEFLPQQSAKLAEAPLRTAPPPRYLWNAIPPPGVYYRTQPEPTRLAQAALNGHGRFRSCLKSISSILQRKTAWHLNSITVSNFAVRYAKSLIVVFAVQRLLAIASPRSSLSSFGHGFRGKGRINAVWLPFLDQVGINLVVQKSLKSVSSYAFILSETLHKTPGTNCIQGNLRDPLFQL